MSSFRVKLKIPQLSKTPAGEGNEVKRLSSTEASAGLQVVGSLAFASSFFSVRRFAGSKGFQKNEQFENI